MRIDNIRNSKEVMKIMVERKYTLNNKTIDIYKELANTMSVVYRSNDVIKLSKNITNKCNNTKYLVKEYGSDGILHENNIEEYGRIAILNFASSKNPGGGFLNGATAQEEYLCNQSNLYNELSFIDSTTEFYKYNRGHVNRGLYSDGIIYSSDVVFFKHNNKNCKIVCCDVISSAAPNAGVAIRNGVSKEDIEATMRRRVNQIITVAASHKVDTLVLGAFGCGVFRNDPKVVARIMSEELKKNNIDKNFKYIVFPMLSSNDRNYKPFYNLFNKVQ